MLTHDADKRLTAREGMNHPYCRQFIATDPHCADPLNRVAAAKVQTPFDDNDKKSTAVYREKLYEEIAKQKEKLKKGDGADAIRR